MDLRTIVQEYRRKASPLGDIGIEIELEGKFNLIASHSPRYWTSVPEGSLRNGVEFITTEPVAIDHLDTVLEDFSKIVAKSTFKSSIRTSTHIHVNVSRSRLEQIYNFLVLWYLLEDVLVQVAGSDRQGNLFCLRASDAQGMITMLKNSLDKRTYMSEFTDQYRYSACNLAAVKKFGSLEFRFLKDMVDTTLLKTWCEGLYKIVHKGLRNDPETPLRMFSAMSNTEFLKSYLTEELYAIVSNLPSKVINDCMSRGYDNSYDLKLHLTKTTFTKPSIHLPNEDLDEELYFQNPTHRIKNKSFPWGAGVTGIDPLMVVLDDIEEVNFNPFPNDAPEPELEDNF